jgi:chaperone modulatory protein CbpM
MSREILRITCEVLEDDTSYGLRELCRACGVSAEYVADLVAEGVVEPRGREPAEWRFGGRALVRVHQARRLQEDLRVNLPGVALALDLLDELEDLRRRQRQMLRR